MQSESRENFVDFRLIPGDGFSYEHLEEYPVWSEFYDYEEREEIIGWGIDPEWFDQEFSRIHDGIFHALYPLLEIDPFPPRMRIYIKARFFTPDGHRLEGYVVNEDARPAIGIFQDGKEFIFNRRLVVEGREDEAVLRQHLLASADSLFPMTYRTDFTDQEGRRIEGVFDFEAS